MNILPKLLVLLVVASASLIAAPAVAQQGSDRLMREFVRPRLLMRYQKQLELTPKQKDAIKNHVKSAQASSVDIEFELEQEMQRLQELVSKNKVKKAETLAQAEKVLALENKMKAIQLGLMIDIKNELTGAQIKKIREFMKKRRERKQRRDDP